MAITVGGKKYSRNDRRISSYKRINRSRGIQERNLGNRSGGGTPQEAAERQYSTPTTLQEANAQANYSQETGPQPIASAVEGGVIFSDEFRGTPIASAASGGVLYQQNQAQESGYVTNFSRENNGLASRSSSSFSSGKNNLQLPVSPAPQRSKFEILGKIEDSAARKQQTAEMSPQGSFKQFRYSTGSFLYSSVAGLGRAGQTILGVFNPTSEGTLAQTGSLLKVGYTEIKQTGGLPSVGSYVQQNPSRAASDVALIAATARLPVPRGLQKYYPKVGVIGETAPEFEVSNVVTTPRRVSAKPSTAVETTAASALRTGSAAETESFIAKLNRDITRRVDVTDFSRLDNIAPSPTKETFKFTTQRRIPRFTEAGDYTGRRGNYLEATQSVSKEFVFPKEEPRGTFVVDTKTNDFLPQSVLTRQQTKQRVVDVRFRKSVAVPSQPQALGDFVRLEERPQYVDLNKALNKRYELYVDSSGVERIRLTQEAKANTAFARKKTFNERMKDILPGNKKGQAQLFSPETVYKDNPSDVLRKRYGQPKPRGRARVSLEEEPPRVSRQTAVPSFIEDTSIERKFFGGKLAPSIIVGSRSSLLPALSYDQGRKQEFRIYQDTSSDLSKVTGEGTSTKQFSFRSLASGTAVGAAVAVTTFLEPSNTFTRPSSGKPTKSPMGKYFGFPESGGGSRSGGGRGGGGSQKTKYAPSLSGVDLFLRTGKGGKSKVSGGKAFTGLEMRTVRGNKKIKV